MSSSSERGFVAVLVGCVASLATRQIVLRLFNASYAGVLSHQGLALDERRARMTSDPLSLVGGLVLGLAAILFGGLVAARIARRRQVVYAAGVGLVTTLVLLALLVCCGTLNQPRLYTILAYGLTIPSAIFGGYIESRRTGQPAGPPADRG